MRKDDLKKREFRKLAAGMICFFLMDPNYGTIVVAYIIRTRTRVGWYVICEY